MRIKFEREKLPIASGIYLIKSACTNKQYVGSSSSIRNRCRVHLADLKKSKHNPYFQQHFNTYGEIDLLFYVLEFCTKENLVAREQYWMDKLHPELNASKYAFSCQGVKLNKDAVKRRTIKILKFFNTDRGLEVRENLSKRLSQNNPMCNSIVKEKQAETRKRNKYKCTELTKEKMSIVHKSYWDSEEGQKEIIKRKARKGNKHPRFGKPLSEEAKLNMRGRVLSNEHKEKLSLALKGKTAWNKGLTKEKDERVMQYCLSRINNPKSKKYES